MRRAATLPLYKTAAQCIVRVLPLLLLLLAIIVALLSSTMAHATVHGIPKAAGNRPAHKKAAEVSFLNRADGFQRYFRAHKCDRAHFHPTLSCVAVNDPGCHDMQVLKPTLIVAEEQSVTVHLTNNLPAAADTTFILLSGFDVTASGRVASLLTREAAPGDAVAFSTFLNHPARAVMSANEPSPLSFESAKSARRRVNDEH
jgi:FtsP/CotA-like multicopper oxidase with cupredoxin domain